MKPTVIILATGGTIVSSGASATQMTGYSIQGVRAEDIVAAVPALADVAHIEVDTISSIDSSSVTFEIWRKLAQAVDRYAAREDVAGVVIMHGTDTMEETAFFLNLICNTEKPVVITGAMRPATAISADGPLNLLNAVTLAALGKTAGMGVVISLNGEIVSARDASKTNTVSVETFQGKTTGFMGVIVGNDVDILAASVKPHTSATEFSYLDIQDAASLPSVPIVYGFADGDADVFNVVSHASPAPAAIVCAAPGNGTLSDQMQCSIEAAIESGIIVCRASRTGSGPVLEGLSVWQEKGILFSRTLSAQKVRILLQLGILKYGRNQTKLQELIDTY